MRHLSMVSAPGIQQKQKNRPHQDGCIVRLGFCFPEFLKAHPLKRLLQGSHRGLPSPVGRFPQESFPMQIILSPEMPKKAIKMRRESYTRTYPSSYVLPIEGGNLRGQIARRAHIFLHLDIMDLY
jgi:hypothetical protein